MSTNYYLYTQNKDLVKKHFRDEYCLTDEPFFSYEVHIAKRSFGWKPLFQAHKNAYQSVKEMLAFFKMHEDEITIADEYGREYFVEELEEELICCPEPPKMKYKIDHKRAVPDAEGDMESPLDHLEVAKRTGEMPASYWNDAEGFNFFEKEFC